MVFNFNHIVAGWAPVLGRFKSKPVDLVTFKKVLNAWQQALADDGWNSLFLSNHDLPRAVSKYGHEGAYRIKSAQMLATVLHLMKGTPFIYQGEEIGMTNAQFQRLEQFRDVETLGQYVAQLAAGVSAEDFIAGASKTSRDNARTPMQWTADKQAGFTDGQPWIDVNPNHVDINVADELERTDGIWAHYKCLIQWRRELPLITYGSYQPIVEEHTAVFAYFLEYKGQILVVIANFTDKTVHVDVPANCCVEGECLVTNDTHRALIDAQLTLSPYEAFAILSD